MRTSHRTCLSVFWNAFLPNNVVLVQALGLCPILAMGINLRYGVTLSVCTIVTMGIADLVFAFLAKRLAAHLQPLVYVLLSSMLLLGTSVLLHELISTEIYAHLYLFLPLMAVNTLYVYRSTLSPSATGTRLAVVMADSLGSSLGFSLVLCVASALREMAISGTLWQIPLGYDARFPEAAHPFIGFVLLGFMAATLQWLKPMFRRKEKEDELL